MSMPDLAGDVTVGTSSPADLAGDITVGVSSPADLAGGVTVGVAPSADIAEVASSADLAEVASSADVADVASLADLAGNITIGVTSLADPAGVVTTGVAFREKFGDSAMVSSGSVCDYDDYFYNKHYNDKPNYFDYEYMGDFDSYPSVHGFVGPDNYELYHDLHGPDECGVYCVSQGDVVVVPYWSEDEEGDMYECDVALPRSGSDEPVNSVVSTSESGGPVGPCAEESDVFEGAVALPQTGSDEPVISAVGLGGPCDATGPVADAPGVVSSECRRDIDRGTLDSIWVWRVNPRSESKVCCGPSHSVIFDEGVLPLICALRIWCVSWTVCG